MITVLLVDDHRLVRRGLRRVLTSDPEIDVVGEAADGREAVAAALELKPAVVVMDIALPALNGIDATRHITTGARTVGVLILSMHADDGYVRESLRAGARGYVLKDGDDVELLHGTRTVAGGGSYFSPAITRLLVQGVLTRSANDPLEEALWRLTGREREVVQLIAEGKPKKEIARILQTRIDTVESHRKHVMEKLGLHGTAAIVRFAIRSRIVR